MNPSLGTGASLRGGGCCDESSGAGSGTAILRKKSYLSRDVLSQTGLRALDVFLSTAFSVGQPPWHGDLCPCPLQALEEARAGFTVEQGQHYLLATVEQGQHYLLAPDSCGQD